MIVWDPELSASIGELEVHGMIHGDPELLVRLIQDPDERPYIWDLEY